ncbi:hypothetical protein OIDMADRAFT_37498 [Oidiodendron maius Zn]|uniref:Mob1/phocein n=1 Tax=Oidiodendron maius (strain Zn) TaxID=913774 RepID=A0A0C3E1T0_OIDMZ|nr:hypothetical protein OIDMADRAFT_37498 [Oidiodendron maius Zn]
MSLPPSSPRLPSPPPPTEIQIGPKSPSLGNSFSSQEPTIEQSVLDANAGRRIHSGTKSADMAAGPPLIPLSELDSAFQLQEHLKALHYSYTKPADSDHTTPITRETASLISAQPEGIDRSLWLYELCRFLTNKCNDLIVGFLFDDPPCSAVTCPEMRASEWQFLCAVHETPKSCCAIDYCCHTLDWATNIVTSQKIFPSRLSLAAGDTVDDRGAGVKHLVSIFRRLHRIFAHAWYQHREVFWRVEGQTGLYVLFKTVCDNYDLLPADNYKLPPEAEGLEPAEEAKPSVPAILKPDAPPAQTQSGEEFLNVSRTNTRRHIRQSPSVGSAVTTVLEADEEEHAVTQKMDDLHIGDDEEGHVKEAESESVENPESQTASHDDARTTSSASSSWDRMSEFQEEKPEPPKTIETTVEEAPPKEEQKDETPTIETGEPESKEEPKVKEDATEETLAEEKQTDES